MQPNKKPFREAFNFYEERLASLEKQAADDEWWKETVLKIDALVRMANYDHLLMDLLVVVHAELERAVKARSNNTPATP